MVSIDADGSIMIIAPSFPEAWSVEVVGDFDGWHEQHYPMRRELDRSWHLRLDPLPGQYVFRYLVDGRHWAIDDDAHGLCHGLDGITRSRIWRPPLRLDTDSLLA